MLFQIYEAVHLPLTLPNSLLEPASSSQVTLRHPETTIYRCFLSDLTGFIEFCRAGPSLQHRLAQVVLPDKSLKPEFNPAVADCRFRAPLAPHLARPQKNANRFIPLCQASIYLDYHWYSVLSSILEIMSWELWGGGLKKRELSVFD